MWLMCILKESFTAAPYDNTCVFLGHMHTVVLRIVPNMYDLLFCVERKRWIFEEYPDCSFPWKWIETEAFKSSFKTQKHHKNDHERSIWHLLCIPIQFINKQTVLKDLLKRFSEEWFAHISKSWTTLMVLVCWCYLFIFGAYLNFMDNNPSKIMEPRKVREQYLHKLLICFLDLPICSLILRNKVVQRGHNSPKS